MSDSCDPQDCHRPGSSVLCLWNFPGKTTGVGYHFLLQEMLRRVTKRDPVFSNKESICDQGEGSFRGEGGVESKLQCGGEFLG